jgi:hypothetical protein
MNNKPKEFASQWEVKTLPGDINITEFNLLDFQKDGSCSLLSRDQFESVVLSGERMAQATGSNKTVPKFANDVTFLNKTCTMPVSNTIFLVIDVGGSHSRAALRMSDTNGEITWKELFDVKNHVFEKWVGIKAGWTGVLHTLAELLEKEIIMTDVSKDNICGAALIWSNRLRVEKLCITSRVPEGTTGYISCPEPGMPIKTWAWQGDPDSGNVNLGSALIGDLKKMGILPRFFLMGNDAPFVAKASTLPADGALVASSGANTTIIPRNGTGLCNAQSGNIEVPFPRGWPNRSDNRPVRIERLVSGAQLPICFETYVKEAAGQGIAELQKIAEGLNAGEISFSGKDLTYLLEDEYCKFTSSNQIREWSQDVFKILRLLAFQVSVLGGMLAGAMAYFSVFNQLDLKNHFVVVVDSSQARFLRGYYKAMQNTFEALLARKKKTGKLLLIPPMILGKPGKLKQISVPMMGAANALNDLLALKDRNTK